MKKTLFTLLFAIGFISAIAQQAPKFVTSVEGIREYSLDNGLKVLLIPDASQSNVVVNIVYNVGSRHEGYGEKGMAHLLEHMLLKVPKTWVTSRKCFLKREARQTVPHGTTARITTKSFLLQMKT
jgi:zinc protease